MSQCDVCIDWDVDGDCEFYERKNPIARKDHKCCECGRVIPKGEQYEYVTGKYEGEFFECKTCWQCAEILRTFSCGAVLHETLWEEMNDYVFENLTLSSECFTELSPGAKTFLLDKWQRWKGLTTVNPNE